MPLAVEQGEKGALNVSVAPPEAHAEEDGVGELDPLPVPQGDARGVAVVVGVPLGAPLPEGCLVSLVVGVLETQNECDAEEEEEADAKMEEDGVAVAFEEPLPP